VVILEFTRIGRLALANSEKASDEAVSGGVSVRLEENPMLILWGRIERAVANRMCAKAHQHHASLWLDERPVQIWPRVRYVDHPRARRDVMEDHAGEAAAS